MGRAFAGPPARRPHRAAARVLLGVTAACYLVGPALAVVSGSPLPGALVIRAGHEAARDLAGALGRGGGGRRRGGGGAGRGGGRRGGRRRRRGRRQGGGRGRGPRVMGLGRVRP